MLKPTTVQWLRSELRSSSLFRAELARELCRRDDWRSPRVELCAASARKGLWQLARDLGLSLPAPSRRTRGCGRHSPQRVRQAFPSVQVQCSLQELGEVRLFLADTPEQPRHRSALLAAEYPLGRGLAGHLESVPRASDLHACLGGREQLAGPPRDLALNAPELLLGAAQQVFAAVLATNGQQRRVAHRQQFARELGGADGGQVGGVEEAGLQCPLLDQPAKRVGAQSGDPAQARIWARILDAGVGEHPPVADQDQPPQAEAAAQGLDMVGNGGGIGGVAGPRKSRAPNWSCSGLTPGTWRLLRS